MLTKNKLFYDYYKEWVKVYKEGAVRKITMNKYMLTVYNSIDKSYYREATNKLNNLFNSEKMAEYKELEKKRDVPALQRPMEEIENVETDPEILMLEKMLAERRSKKKQQNDEM
ncbi:MAG: hypothetical protein PHW00_05010 [Clostridia bacterium]|nr:hypothetical protein [Clostridia bacterium]